MDTIPVRLYKYYLTYLAAPVNRLRRRQGEQKSLFVAKFDGFGDFILLLPFLKKLRDEGYRLTVTGNDFQKEILDHSGINAAIILFKAQTGKALRSTLDAVRNVRPACAVNLSMSAWGGILVNQTRAPMTAGLVQEREWYSYKGIKLLYDRSVSYDPSLHNFEVIGRFFSDILGTAMVEPYLDRPAASSVEVAVHPYGKWPPRRWPRFGELITLLARHGYSCVLLGTPEEHALTDLAACGEKTAGCRIVPLRSTADLLAEIERCRAFIGNDSGPAHYAALIGRPTFVLWGPGNYDRIRPLGRDVHIFKKEIACRPCRQRGERCVRGANECLQMIGVEEVFEKFRETVKPPKIS
jgi:ADP-heptose:LPS heptosyltransferase